MGRSKRGQFFTPLDLRNAGNGRHFILIAPLQYLDDRPDGIPIHITVPMGFVTDLASIPRGLWNLFPPHGRYDYAAVVHDYLYRTDAMAGADIPMVSQALADRTMLHAMCDSPCPPHAVSRRLIYWGLRSFGGHAFHQHPVAWRPTGLEHAQPPIS